MSYEIYTTQLPAWENQQAWKAQNAKRIQQAWTERAGHSWDWWASLSFRQNKNGAYLVLPESKKKKEDAKPRVWSVRGAISNILQEEEKPQRRIVMVDEIEAEKVFYRWLARLRFSIGNPATHIFGGVETKTKKKHRTGLHIHALIAAPGLEKASKHRWEIKWEKKMGCGNAKIKTVEKDETLTDYTGKEAIEGRIITKSYKGNETKPYRTYLDL